MHKPITTLILLFTVAGLCAQNLKTKDMLRIMQCTDKTCFDSLLLQKGYTVEETLLTDTTAIYRYKQAQKKFDVFDGRYIWYNYAELAIKNPNNFSLQIHELSKREFNNRFRVFKRLGYRYMFSTWYSNNHYNSEKMPALYLTTGNYPMGWHVNVSLYSIQLSTMPPKPENPEEFKTRNPDE